jgi:hypothetical protein
MRDATLPEEYAATISTGLWDNCDVLPAAKPNAQGRALDATTVKIYQYVAVSAAVPR